MGHYLYFVAVDAENSTEARAIAEQTLNENNFVFNEGYWGGGHCDWYVIGGRWSGVLSGSTDKKNRDPYKHNGYEDDAQKVTSSLLQRLKKRFPNVNVFFPEQLEEQDFNEIDLKAAKDKFLVVIDYHN